MHKVLLVDDEPWILKGLKRRIDWNACGFSLVETAGDGQQALQSIRAAPPDLVVTDVRLPGLTGIELMRQARTIRDDIVFVVISGFSEFEYAREALRLGALEYLIKPIRSEELRDAVESARVYIDRTKYERRKQNLWQLATQIETLGTADPVGKSLRPDGTLHYACAFVDSLHEPVRELSISGLATNHRTTNFGPSRQLVVLPLRGPEAIGGVSSELSRQRDETTTVGMSSVSSDPAALPQLMRESRLASLDRFVTEECSLYHFGAGNMNALSQILRDIDHSFVNGRSDLLHALLEDVVTILRRSQTGMNGLVHFYNHYCAAIDQASLHRSGSRFPIAVCGDPEQLATTHGQIGHLILYLHRTLAHLEESSDWSSEEKQARPEVVAQVKEYVDLHFRDQIGVGTLAAEFLIHPSYLSTAFRELVGQNLTSYLRGLRLDHARLLLDSTDLQIQDVADLCGFGDYFHFAKTFRREIGCTPSEYRETTRP